MTNQPRVCKGSECPNFRDEPKQCVLLAGEGLSPLLNHAPCRDGLLRHINRVAQAVARRSHRHLLVSADDLVQETLSKLLQHGPWRGAPEAFVYGYLPKVLETHALRQSTGHRKVARRCGTCAFGVKTQKYGTTEVRCQHPEARMAGKTVGFQLPVLPSCAGFSGKTRAGRHGCSNVVYEKNCVDICGTCTNENCGHRKAGAKMVHWDPTPETLGCNLHTYPATDAEVNSLSTYTFEAGPTSVSELDMIVLVDEAQDFVRKHCSECKTVYDIEEVLERQMQRVGITCEPATVERLAETLFRLLTIVRTRDNAIAGK